MIKQPFKQIYYLAPDNTKLWFFEGRTRALQSWQNFGMPQINFIEDRGPNQHGTTVRDWRAQTRSITLEWFGQDCNGRQCEYATVVEKIRPTHANSPGYLRVINQDTSLLEIPAWIRQGPGGNWSIDSGLRNLQVRDSLQFHCADPIWREVIPETISVVVDVEDSCLPICLPTCIGTGILGASVDICYRGSWPGDQITFILTGPLNTPVITNITTGRIIELNYNIPINDIVTITILPESATVISQLNGNIIGTVTNISDLVFFSLAPRQINTLTFSGAGGLENSSAIVMIYFNRYLSVYDTCVEISCDEPAADTTSFITTWKTDNNGLSANNQIALPLISSGAYNFIVDWGDGGNQDTITTWNQAETTHTYAAVGTYTVTIKGQCHGWQFNYTGDSEKILDISQWGTSLRLGNDTNYFSGCLNLNITATDSPDLTGTTTLEAMFFDCLLLTGTSAFNSWNVSGVTSMHSMFSGCNIFNQNITNWNVSNVTNMREMFFSCDAFDQNISLWDVGNVTDMSLMFSGCDVFNQNISAWDVSNVTLMNNMFNTAISFDQNLGAWNVGNVTSMINMFSNVTLSTSNYDAILVGWESLSPALQNNVTFNGGNSQYTGVGAGGTARAALIANHSWTIIDGGAV